MTIKIIFRTSQGNRRGKPRAKRFGIEPGANDEETTQRATAAFWAWRRSRTNDGRRSPLKMEILDVQF